MALEHESPNEKAAREGREMLRRTASYAALTWVMEHVCRAVVALETIAAAQKRRLQLFEEDSKREEQKLALMREMQAKQNQLTDHITHDDRKEPWQRDGDDGDSGPG